MHLRAIYKMHPTHATNKQTIAITLPRVLFTLVNAWSFSSHHHHLGDDLLAGTHILRAYYQIVTYEKEKDEGRDRHVRKLRSI